MATGRYSLAAATSAAGEILALGGYDGTTSLDTAERFIPSQNAWVPIAPMPSRRYGFAAATASTGDIYAMGGFSPADFASEVFAYRPTTNTWSTPTSLPTLRADLGVVAVGPKIIAVGGHVSGGFPTGAVEAFDVTTQSWTSLPSMMTPRYGLGVAATHDGRIYTIGGVASGPSFGDGTSIVEVYDPTTNAWSSRAPMPTARAGLSAITGTDGRIYAIGGYSGAAGWLATVESYDPATNTWRAEPDMPTAREGLASAKGSDGALYALGGESQGTNYLGSVEAFLPPTVDAHVTVAISGAGSGTVTSSPSGITCPPTCDATFALGSDVTLHAAPAQSSVFSGWTGACTGGQDCTLHLSGDASVTATFALATVRLDGSVVYMTKRSAPSSARWDLWTARVDGSNAIELLPNGLEPDASASGANVVFARGGMIYSVPADGSTAPVQLTTLTTDAVPAVSPSDGGIAFQRNAGSYDIWVAGASGQNPHPLLTWPSYETDPSWSPDGRFLTFVSNRAGEYDVWLARSDGSGRAVNLTAGDGLVSHFPSWSPACDRLVVASSVPAQANAYNLYYVRLPQLTQTQLTSYPSDEQAPSWSPDGDRIAFESTRSVGPGDQAGDTNVWVMRSDGAGTPIVVAPTPAQDQRPDWLLPMPSTAASSCLKDTDQDGLWDLDEMTGTTSPVSADTDDDDLTDGDEIGLGTEPNNPDTDDDGSPDGGEVGNGTDPTNPADGGLTSRPVANDDVVWAEPGITTMVEAPGVLRNDTPSPNATLTRAFLIGTDAPDGTVTLGSSGELTFRAPSQSAYAEYAVQYKVKDSSGAWSNVATVDVFVIGPNRRPTAVADTFEVRPSKMPLVVQAPGVLSNDTDPDGVRPVAARTTSSLTGLTFQLDGSFVFNRSGTTAGQSFQFSYVARDRLGTESSAVATVTIRIVNRVPTAIPETYRVQAGTTGRVQAPGVLANDSDGDGGLPTSAIIVGTPPTGFQLNADGSFRYAPPTNTGSKTVSFSYRARDADGGLSTAVTDTINVVANRAPVARHDFLTVIEGQSISVGVPGILGNDSDPDGLPPIRAVVDHINFKATAQDGSRNYVWGGDGSLTFHSARFAAPFTAEIDYHAVDRQGASSNRATVFISIVAPPTPPPPPEPPTARNDTYRVIFPDPSVATVTVTGNVITNPDGRDTDPEGGTLFARLLDTGDIGFLTCCDQTYAFTFGADGSFSWTVPQRLLYKKFTITYEVTDRQGLSSRAQATFDVTPPDFGPTRSATVRVKHVFGALGHNYYEGRFSFSYKTNNFGVQMVADPPETMITTHAVDDDLATAALMGVAAFGGFSSSGVEPPIEVTGSVPRGSWELYVRPEFEVCLDGLAVADLLIPKLGLLAKAADWIIGRILGSRIIKTVLERLDEMVSNVHVKKAGEEAIDEGVEEIVDYVSEFDVPPVNLVCHGFGQGVTFEIHADGSIPTYQVDDAAPNVSNDFTSVTVTQS